MLIVVKTLETNYQYWWLSLLSNFEVDNQKRCIQTKSCHSSAISVRPRTGPAPQHPLQKGNMGDTCITMIPWKFRDKFQPGWLSDRTFPKWQQSCSGPRWPHDVNSIIKINFIYAKLVRATPKHNQKDKFYLSNVSSFVQTTFVISSGGKAHTRDTVNIVFMVSWYFSNSKGGSHILTR